MISYIETEWMVAPPNDLIRAQNEGLVINPLLGLESVKISDFVPEEKNYQGSTIIIFLSVAGSSSPFSNFMKQFKNIGKELWYTLPEDSSERIDEYL